MLHYLYDIDIVTLVNSMRLTITYLKMKYYCYWISFIHYHKAWLLEYHVILLVHLQITLFLCLPLARSNHLLKSFSFTVSMIMPVVYCLFVTVCGLFKNYVGTSAANLDFFFFFSNIHHVFVNDPVRIFHLFTYRHDLYICITHVW